MFGEHFARMTRFYFRAGHPHPPPGLPGARGHHAPRASRRTWSWARRSSASSTSSAGTRSAAWTTSCSASGSHRPVAGAGARADPALRRGGRAADPQEVPGAGPPGHPARLPLVGPPPDTWAIPADDAGAREVAPGLWQLRLPVPWQAVVHVNAYAMDHPDGGRSSSTAAAPGAPSRRGRAREGAGRGRALRRRRPAAGRHACALRPHRPRRPGDRAQRSAAVDAPGHRALLRRDARSRGHPGRARAPLPRRGRPRGLLPAYRDVREETDGVLAPVEPDRALGEGDLVPSALGDWEVVPTPGHAPSHLAFSSPSTAWRSSATSSAPASALLRLRLHPRPRRRAAGVVRPGGVHRRHPPGPARARAARSRT